MRSSASIIKVAIIIFFRNWWSGCGGSSDSIVIKCCFLYSLQFRYKIVDMHIGRSNMDPHRELFDYNPIVDQKKNYSSTSTARNNCSNHIRS